jgi:chitodextrinase
MKELGMRTIAIASLAVAALASATVLISTEGQSKPAHVSGLPACAIAWDSSAEYIGGDVVSKGEIRYLANWWTRDDPTKHNGEPESGSPWTAQGACAPGDSDDGKKEGR